MDSIIEDNALAVVVGIDHYGVAVPSLEGPVADAGRFTRLLLDRKLPPERIRLFVDRPDDIELADVPCEIERRTPSLEDIVKFFEKELPTLEGSKLILFWGGHGVLEGADRRLFLTGAGRTNPTSLEFENLVQYLGTKPFEDRFYTQILITDVCADAQAFRYGSNGHTFNRGPVSRKVEQFILYAASRGERAINLPFERSGRFSRQFFNLMREEGMENWPWDMPVIAGALQARFEEFPDQCPQYVSKRDWKGNVEAFGVPPEALAPFDSLRLRRLAGAVPRAYGRHRWEAFTETLRGTKALRDQPANRLAIEDRFRTKHRLDVSLDPMSERFSDAVRHVISNGLLGVLIEELVDAGEAEAQLQASEIKLEKLFDLTNMASETFLGVVGALASAPNLIVPAFQRIQERFVDRDYPVPIWSEIVAFVGERASPGKGGDLVLDFLRDLWKAADLSEQKALGEAIRILGGPVPEATADAKPSKAAASPEPLYLAVEITKDGYEHGKYQFQTTAWWEDHAFKGIEYPGRTLKASGILPEEMLADLGHGLQDFLERCSVANRERIVIEFVVPKEFLRSDFPRLSLCMRTEDPADGSWLGSIVAWTLRPSTYRGHLQRMTNLEVRWASPATVQDVHHVIEPHESAEQEIRTRWGVETNQADPSRCVFLGFMCPKASEGEKVLLAISKAGIPAAVWFHSREGADEAFSNHLRKELTHRPLNELPKVLKRLRTEARQNGAPKVWEHSVLLYDHPARMARPTEELFAFEEIA